MMTSQPTTYRDPLIPIRITLYGLAVVLLATITIINADERFLSEWRAYRERDRARTEASYRNFGMLTKAMFYKGFEDRLPPEERALMPHP